MAALKRTALLLLSALAVASCDSPSGPKPARSAAHVDVVSGNAQTAVAGAGLGSPLVVKVTDAKGKPVVGQAVQYQVLSGGGSLSANSATTGSDGQAQVTWTLGTVARDTQKVEARVLDSSGGVLASAVFKAVALPDVPAALTKVSGDAQTGAVGSALADSLAVKLADRFGNVISGQTITFAVTSGDGAVTPTTRTTDSTGIARTQWKLGARLDVPQGASAAFGSLAPATFAATATVAGTLAKVSGDEQTGAVGHVLGDSLAVRLTTAAGTPVRGATVQWTTTAGSLVPATSTTDANGTAKTSWLLPNASGPQTAGASVVGGSSTAAFTATATPDAAAQLEKVSGDGQTGAVGTTLADSLAVRLADRFGNAISGQTVAFAVTSGDGSVSPTTQTTDAAGIVRTQWKLGARLDAPQSASASFGSLAPATFAATATVAGGLTKVGGDAQTGTVRHVLADSLAVQLTTADGAPVRGATIQWTTIGGSLVPTTTVTDANGVARTAWLLGSAVGGQTATAPVTGGSQTVSFTATASADPADHLEVVSGDGQTATVGTAFADSLVVRAVSGSGGPLAGATVTWAAIGGGTASPATSVTDAAGLAKTLWTAGTNVALAQKVSATLGGSTVTFTGTATPGAPVGTRVYAGNGQSGTPNTALTDSIGARVIDGYENGVPGVPVTWTVTYGGGSVSPATSTTGPNGVAWTHWTLGPANSGNTLTAQYGTLPAAEFTASGQGIVLRYVTPYDGYVTAGDLPVSIGITAPHPVASAEATVRDRSAALHYSYAGSGTEKIWAGTVSLSGLATRDTFTVTVTVTDSAGVTGSRSQQFKRNQPPTLVLDSAYASAVATPYIHLAVHCVDDDPAGCRSVTAYLAGSPETKLAGGPGTTLNEVVSLAASQGKRVPIVIRAFDSDGFSAVANLSIYVESNPHLSVEATVDGDIRDADASRIAYVTSAGPRVLRLRGRTDGSDTAVFALGAAVLDTALVTPTGVIFRLQQSSGSAWPVYEWYNGTLIDRGTSLAGTPLSVAGGYAAWTTYPAGAAYRVFGTNQLSTVAGAGWADVAANGDLVYVSGDSAIFRLRGGAVQRVVGNSGHLRAPKTDGTNVAYSQSFSDPLCFTCASSIRLNMPAGDTLLATNGSVGDPSWWQVGGGWAAYEHLNSGGQTAEIWTLSPGGSRALVAGAAAGLVAVGASGEVVYRQGTSFYVSAPPYSSPAAVAAVFDTNRLMFRGGVLYDRLGGTLFRVTYP